MGEIKVIAFVAPLKWVEYKAIDDKSKELKLVEHWDSEKWQMVAVQTMVKRFMTDGIPPVKQAKDVLGVSNVFLFGGKSHYYGEKAIIAVDQGLETLGRVNSEFLLNKTLSRLQIFFYLFILQINSTIIPTVNSFIVQGTRAGLWKGQVYSCVSKTWRIKWF